jgi:hypothetical protein
MSKQLVESIDRYRELNASIDWEYPVLDDLEQLARSADYLINQLAGELVMRGKQRGMVAEAWA